MIGLDFQKRGPQLPMYQHPLEAILEIEQTLRQLTLVLMQQNRELLQQFKITPAQFKALQWLYEEGELTIGDLSGKMVLACSTTTDLIDRMERQGLVERIRDASDRRVVRVVLLDKGRRLFEDILQAKRRLLQRILQPYPPEAVERLNLFLRQLLEDLHVGAVNTTRE